MFRCSLSCCCHILLHCVRLSCVLMPQVFILFCCSVTCCPLVCCPVSLAPCPSDVTVFGILQLQVLLLLVC
jgi:hypothetical protein